MMGIPYLGNYLPTAFQDLGAIFDESHSDMFSYIIFMGFNAGSYRIIPPGVIDGCEDIHTPPSRSAWAQRD